MILALLAWLAPAGHAQVSTGPVVGVIRVHRLDIFDPKVPGEDWWLFRAANWIHVTTREEVIRRELLLKPGELFDPFKSLESERNLRANGYYRRAEIRPVPRPGGTLDLEVETQDSWTTIVQLSVGTEGGQRFVIYGAEEKNLLGLNKDASFVHSQNGALVQNELRYGDPRFLGSRYNLSTLYGTTDKGQSEGVGLTRPFFSIETPYATDTGWSRITRERLIFKDAEQQSAFISNVRTVQASGGVRFGDDRWAVHRAQAGWYSERDLFTSEQGTTLSLPSDRELSGPTVGYSWIRPRYIKETYLNLMERVEDFNLGNELGIEGGWMGRALGSDADRLIYSVKDQQGWRLVPGAFILAQAGVEGRARAQRPENVLFFGNANLFWKSPGRRLAQTWVAHLESTAGRRLDGENQVLLGGNNGLRGYRSFSFAGDKAILVNVEDRLFYPGEFFHLARFGGAVFFDSGAVAPPNAGFAFSQFRSDVGAGLRASSTRSTGGGVLRVDLAYALDGGPGGTRWVLSVKGGQAFDVFNSSARSVKQSPSSRLDSIQPPPVQ